MRVLLVGAELTPLAKVGGLGDYLGSLPKALVSLGVYPTVALPYHSTIRSHHITSRQVATLKVPFGKTTEVVSVWKTVIPDSAVPLYLFKNKRYLSTGAIYSSKSVWDPVQHRFATGKHSDLLRYLFFSLTIFQWLKTKPLDLDVVHASDWHMASLIALLKTSRATADLRSLLTIHNVDVGARGAAKPLSLRGHYVDLLPAELSAHINWREAQADRSIRLFAIGLQQADRINTVSPQYAKELLTTSAGHGLEKILRRKQQQFSAILNGIDTSLFNPATDQFVLQHYSWKNRQKRSVNKLLLQQQLGWKQNANKPFLSMVARIDAQKGFDLVLQALPQLSKLNVQLCITGTGDPYYERRLKIAAKRYKKWLHYNDSYDEALGQQMYAASDIFLMPSRYEPCGLSQLIAMRYGSVPVVHGTGGLKNTVFQHKNGFVFNHYTVTDFMESLSEAIHWYRTQPRRWLKLQQAGMTADFSWSVSARSYARLYRQTISTK